MSENNEQIKMAEKNVGLIAKAVAIIAVVLLHVLSLFPASIYTTSDFNTLFMIINQAARFSVPLFLALSGFGLARKYGGKNLSVSKFLKSRLEKLLPLYLLWSGILLIIFQISNTWFQGEINLWQALLLGNTDYHLYFVPLLLQFYILFALFSKFFAQRHLVWLMVGAGVLQIVFFAIMRFISLQEGGVFAQWLLNDQIQYRLIINWLFYFLLGSFVAQLDLQWFRKRPIWGVALLAIGIASLSWGVLDSGQLMRSTENIIFSTSFIRPSVFAYSTALILAVIIYGPVLLHVKKWSFATLQKIGEHSFLIYLSHTLVLRIIAGLVTSEQRPSTLLIAIGLFVVGVIVSGKLTSTGYVPSLLIARK